ncbi:MAG TPA: hypothetical protein VM555_06370 [Tahibacter sp.]|nr:hypothetical protein [Tahibacter sp.]
MDLDLARSVEIIQNYQAVVKQWPTTATRLQLGADDRERMAAAFRLAG